MGDYNEAKEPWKRKLKVVFLRLQVKLMQKMKEDANRHKEAELKRTREIAQLRKVIRIPYSVFRYVSASRYLHSAVLDQSSKPKETGI